MVLKYEHDQRSWDDLRCTFLIDSSLEQNLTSTNRIHENMSILALVYGLQYDFFYESNLVFFSHSF